jgi:aspartate/methionine/tyrosine aminotransferase
MPVLMDEAYHHFVEDPTYATSIPYILEGRPVIVARTFSKIYGMAGPAAGLRDRAKDMIDRMRQYSTGSVQRARQVGRRDGAAGSERRDARPHGYERTKKKTIASSRRSAST